MNLQNKNVIFLGDSITEGAMATAPQNVYHQIFGKIVVLCQMLGRKKNLAL